jgi:hypothetical protein
MSQHLRYEVGQHDASLRRQSRDAQTRLTRARGNVEMLMIFSDVETLDNRCADRGRPFHLPRPAEHRQFGGDGCSGNWSSSSEAMEQGPTPTPLFSRTASASSMRSAVPNSHSQGFTVDDSKKRAVGFKLSEGMEVPAELASRFKFARQKSKLAGTIRGSFFNIKNEY